MHLTAVKNAMTRQLYLSRSKAHIFPYADATTQAKTYTKTPKASSMNMTLHGSIDLERATTSIRLSSYFPSPHDSSPWL